MKHTLLIAFFGLTSLLQAQTIDIGQIKLNGTIGYCISLDELRVSNIKIDSIKPIPELMDMSTADSIIYLGRTYFEYFSNSNNCVLSAIEFDIRVSEVSIGNLKLNNKTTIEFIQSAFPDDCQSTEPIKIYQDPKFYRTCRIPISFNGQLTDSRLLFLFLDGKLKRIYIWEPS